MSEQRPPDVQWRAPPRQYVVLLGAAALLGAGVALMVTAGLGVASWQVFETGLVATTGWSFGTVVVVESVVALAIAWLAFGQPPGPATLLFAFAVGPSIDVLLRALSAPTSLAMQVMMLAAGTAAIGLGVGFYVGAGLGTSAQDSLFVGLCRRFGWRARDTRLGTDLALVGAGWLLGGQVGVGTIVITLGLPPLVEPAMRLGSRVAGLPLAVPTAATASPQFGTTAT